MPLPRFYYHPVSPFFSPPTCCNVFHKKCKSAKTQQSFPPKGHKGCLLCPLFVLPTRPQQHKVALLAKSFSWAPPLFLQATEKQWDKSAFFCPCGFKECPENSIKKYVHVIWGGSNCSVFITVGNDHLGHWALVSSLSPEVFSSRGDGDCGEKLGWHTGPALVFQVFWMRHTHTHTRLTDSLLAGFLSQGRWGELVPLESEPGHN